MHGSAFSHLRQKNSFCLYSPKTILGGQENMDWKWLFASLSLPLPALLLPDTKQTSTHFLCHGTRIQWMVAVVMACVSKKNWLASVLKQT